MPYPDSRPPPRRLAIPASIAACCLAVVLATGGSSVAQTAQLGEVRAQREEIRSALAEQNVVVDALLGEVSALRVREDKVAAELAEQEAELAVAREELSRARDELAQTKQQLQGALGELRKLLVGIYRYGEPDMATMVLEANGLVQAVTIRTYFDHVQSYQAEVVGRVRGLRTDARDLVWTIEASIERMEVARAAIEKRQQELAASRVELEEREAALDAAQAERREELEKLKGREQSLVDALSTPAPATDATTPAAPAESVPSPNGATASLNSDGTVTAPANAPDAVKGAVAAANEISDMPYLYGGGHGSFEASGYDCSGAVSYALHGGGLLSSPLDSTGFMTWGEGGPGQWVTVYSNPGHAYVVIAGLRFDTSGGAGPRWQAPRDPAGFVATHPPGY